MKRILLVSTAGADEPWLVSPAAQLAEETGAEITVLAVDDVESQRFAALPRAELVKQAQETAQRIVDRLAETGVAATPIARSGAATATAIEFADEIDADLIVVGSSRRGGVVKRLLGSLPLDLVQRSGRQVLVVTEPG
ncbi:MAG TPA: universal stress protein [Thermoleophilaceae bacterium]|nr:universal stress protein [Thermoleophilaceae bacterium]